MAGGDTWIIWGFTELQLCSRRCHLNQLVSATKRAIISTNKLWAFTERHRGFQPRANRRGWRIKQCEKPRGHFREWRGANVESNHLPQIAHLKSLTPKHPKTIRPNNWLTNIRVLETNNEQIKYWRRVQETNRAEHRTKASWTLSLESFWCYFDGPPEVIGLRTHQERPIDIRRQLLTLTHHSTRCK